MNYVNCLSLLCPGHVCDVGLFVCLLVAFVCLFVCVLFVCLFCFCVCFCFVSLSPVFLYSAPAMCAMSASPVQSITLQNSVALICFRVNFSTTCLHCTYCVFLKFIHREHRIGLFEHTIVCFLASVICTSQYEHHHKAAHLSAIIARRPDLLSVTTPL